MGGAVRRPVPGRYRLRRQVTVKAVELVAVPAAVVTLTLPVVAPVGTFTVMAVFESLATLATLPPNVTEVAP